MARFEVREREWQAQVTEAARLLGWRVYHTHDSRRSEPGWPDLAMVRERFIVAELKTETGKVSPAQQRWLTALRAAGVETYIWRPSDYERMVQTLRHRQANNEQGEDS